MKNANGDLPPDLQPFASLLALSPVRPKYRDAQPPDVQEAFQFLLVTAMHEAGKLELLSVAEVEGQWHYTTGVSGEDVK